MSYLIAALLVGGLFVWSPKYDVEPLESTETDPATSAVIPTSPLFVHVRFGPPEIFGTDGWSPQESAGRVLEVGRVVDLPADCKETLMSSSLPVSGSLRLSVDASGDATLLEVNDGTGIGCGDQAISVMADALRYEWLPSDRFSAPVELIQPGTLLNVAEPL